MKIICVHCGWRNEYRIDHRSYEQYWTGSWNKAWKKFRPVRDLNPWPLRYGPEFFFQALFQDRFYIRYHVMLQSTDAYPLLISGSFILSSLKELSMYIGEKAEKSDRISSLFGMSLWSIIFTPSHASLTLNSDIYRRCIY